MARFRRTLGKEVSWRGRGIHTGRESGVRVLPAEPGEGIIFSLDSGRFPVKDAFRDGSRRSMELTFPGGGSVRTVEHLLAAIAGVGLDDAVIAPEGPEIPILDGSAFLFASAMIEGGVVETDIPYNPAYLSSPICVCDGPSSVCAIPSEEFRITYVIDYPGSAIGTEMKDVLVTEETFMSEIAPARTFCLESEADSLREAGLALGGSLENTLVIGAGGPLGSGYRVERECAAHKIADFMGDMACAGFTANARYICVRAGHRLHSRLMDRIAKSALNNSGR